MTLRSMLSASICTLLLAAHAWAVPPQPRAGEPLPELTSAARHRFNEGRAYYITPLAVVDGLGPAFNQPSCVACHESPVGGWGATSVTRFGNLSGGVFDFLEELGGPVLQRQGISPACVETLPPPSVANHVRDRVTPSVLAFGLVEAIPDAALVALADPNDANADGISGRVHLVHTLADPTGPLRAGRFGWKSQIAVVRDFSSDAARNEMGLTNALLPLETAPSGDAALLADCDAVPEIEDQPDAFGATFIDAVTDFQRYLAPPPQSPRSGMAGESIFNAVGCVKCHARQFTTADLPTLEPALRNRVIRPYSDFLLHDMGALADGIPDGDALGSEMRTPPLWNLRTRPVLLHNGSANQPQFAVRVEAAIAAHAGEATASRNAYAALSTADKAKVLAFLDSLGRDDYDADGDGLLTGLDYGIVVTHAGDTAVSPDEAWSVADLDQNGLLQADEINGLRSLLGIPADCNQNGVTDWSEILSGATSDLNANGVPDECDQSSCTARVKRVSGTGGAIPDAGGGSLTRSIAVAAPAGNPAIHSVRVTLDISHTWLSDLTITLRRGSDPAVTLHSGCGTFHDVNGRYWLTDTAWEGATDSLVPICQGTLLDGGGTNSETRFTFQPGLYRPSQGTATTAFQPMRGVPMGATWTLTITDGRTNDVGTLNGWSIDFRYADPSPTDCDGTGGPDCAQLAADPSLDCDHDRVLDACQPLAGDCDGNGVRDRCQIAAGDGQDCDANGTLDACDISTGVARDCNGNGVPDSCELVDGDEADSDSDTVLDSCERAFGDLNLDGVVNAADLAMLLGMWLTVDSVVGDLNGDGIVNAADLAMLLGRWNDVPPWSQPIITGVSPSVGPTAGGTAITITGANLWGTTSVTVGGVAATGVAVVNATTVTAVTPSGAAGPQDVRVVNGAGSATLAGGFTFVAPPAPTILSVAPNSGSTAGGTAITITGTNLTDTNSVTIGGVAATSVSVVNATTVTAVTPAGTAGAKTVSLTTPVGTGNLTNGFTYTTVWYTVLEQNPDPAVVTSATLRNAITATGYPWRVRDNGTQIEMVLIPPGTFNMGCSPSSTSGGCNPEESPVHSVTLTSGFYIGRYEVTQAQWHAKMGTNPSFFVARPENGNTANTNRPVETVSWNQIEGSGGFLAGTGLRLPSEAEWEYAYRGGTTTAFHGFTGYLDGTNDDTLVGNIARFMGNNGSPFTPTYGTKAVGTRKANGFGLQDMAGNVSEWVNDWLDYYDWSASSNPAGPAYGSYRVYRGGDWGSNSRALRSSFRGFEYPDVPSACIGFRVARSLSEGPTISSVTPISGTTAGGASITITGTNLSGTSSVTIGGTAATSVSVLNSTTVTAVTPGGATGAQTVSITTQAGLATLRNGFTYTDAGYAVLEQHPDPAIVTSAAMRNAITATGYPWLVRDNCTQIEMVLVPPGTFDMGCSPSNQHGCEWWESPVHSVTITSAFYMGRYEVTQAQWQARMGSNPSFFRESNGFPESSNRPVEMVVWNHIAGAGGFLSGTGLRLPTEAEWEYSCRAGTTTAFHGFTGYLSGTNDDTLVGDIAWYWGNNGASGSATDGTKAVGQKRANGFGLHDMSGNVWEICGDWYGDYTPLPQTNPTGPGSGAYRVVRGGGYTSDSGEARSSYRVVSIFPSGNTGFRVARTLERTEVPTVLSVSPNSGSTSGGTAITITGTNLTGTSSVTVGGSAATSVSVVNSTTVTAVTPAGAAGAANVSLTTPYGTATANGAFTYQLYGTPTISSVTPNSGSTAGGTAITITGSNLTGTSSVTIGGTAATSVSVVNSTTVTAVTPAGAAGAANVSLTTPYGTATANGAFTYQTYSTPTISSVAPNSGSTAGGTAITITGTNLTGTTSVTIGGAAATSVSVVNATTVTAVTPAGTSGAKTVSVTTPGGTASLTSGFTYGLSPSISSVTPNVGPTAGGTAITITGTNLTGTSSVTVGGSAATSVSVVNSTTVTAVTPAGAAGAANVSLTTPYGTATASGAFTYQLYGTPTISSVNPNSGPLAGGTAITITGTNLTGTSSVTIGGGVATSVSVVNATTVTAVTPAGTAGAKTVSVTTPGGTANLTNGFTYTTVWYTVLEQNPDPAVVTSATLRDAITATGYPWRVRDNGTQIEMVLIPPGTFNMGCSASNQFACNSVESPVHAVTLTSAFYMGRYEVTQAQWQARMGSNPSYFVARPENGNTANTNRPVESVSWNQIAGTGGFLSGTGLRLPTEAEWEYACRAGTTTAFHGFTGYLSGTNDDTLVGNIAWFFGNNGASGTATYGTKAVGQKLANGFGLHDMSGNVYEWVNDWYGSTYYASSPSSNPTGPSTGTNRVLRGGFWVNSSDGVRSSVRSGNSPDSTGVNVGFRVARAPL